MGDPRDSSVAVRLSRTYDVERLQRDARALEGLRWAPVQEYNPLSDELVPDFRPGGEGVSLYGKGGRWDSALVGMGVEPYQETELLRHTPYLKEVLDGLECRKFAVRLLALYPDAVIRQHVDAYIGFGFGLLRFHIPILDHPKAVFTVGDSHVRWEEGELWWCDFAIPHHAHNGSALRRVHLVIDVAVNDFVLGLFPPEFIAQKRKAGITKDLAPYPLPREALDRFVCDVVAPPGLIQGVDVEIPAAIRIVNDRLTVVVNDRPIIGLEPVSPTRFSLFGAPHTLFIDYRLERGRIAEVAAIRPRNHTDASHLERLPFKLCA